MGDQFAEGYVEDGEGPVHAVDLAPFVIDIDCVTTRQFAKFVEETGWLTEAERQGFSGVFQLAVMARNADVIGPMGVPWWLAVRGADWEHPFGPLSSADELLDHPVVHVSHGDALAYCAWAGRDLPSEAEWEYAARGGLVGKRYAWGDELMPDGRHRANIWQGAFPLFNSGEDGWRATAPVGSFEPNGFGLHQTAGNVWEWCRGLVLAGLLRHLATGQSARTRPWRGTRHARGFLPLPRVILQPLPGSPRGAATRPILRRATSASGPCAGTEAAIRAEAGKSPRENKVMTLSLWRNL